MNNKQRAALKRATRLIRQGEIIAFPTETVYGLGADAFNPAAVRKIFKAKGRPADNPLIVHVSDKKMLHRVVRTVPKTAQELMDQFWPGPLSLLCQKHPALPKIVTAGLPSVVVRMPCHPVALTLIRAAGTPIAAPSANLSGKPSGTTAAHVREDFPNILVLDGGKARHGIESTVIDTKGERPRILRLGAITLEELKRVVPDITIAPHTAKRPSSPGMKYRHYAPDRPLRLFKTKRSLLQYAQQCAKRGQKPIILCTNDNAKAFSKYATVLLGATMESIARNLFSALRTKRQGDCLLMLEVSEQGKGRAIMDRLRKAAIK